MLPDTQEPEPVNSSSVVVPLPVRPWQNSQYEAVKNDQRGDPPLQPVLHPYSLAPLPLTHPFQYHPKAIYDQTSCSAMLQFPCAGFKVLLP